MVRNVRTGQWAFGTSCHPRFATVGGRTWNDLGDAQRWVYRYNTGHRWYRDKPIGDPLEIVEFEMTEKRVVPQEERT